MLFIFPMIVDRSKIGFTRPWRGLPAKTQQVHNEAAGATVHWDAKEDNIDAIDIARMAPHPPQKGRRDTIYIFLLRLAVGKSENGKPRPPARLHLFLNAVREAGSVIVETATGRRSDRPKDYAAMVDWALKSASRGVANLPPGFSKMGRKPKVFTEAEIAAAKKVWKDHRTYRTDTIATENLPKGMSIYDAKDMFGSSGRKPGRKPEQKRRQ